MRKIIIAAIAFVVYPCVCMLISDVISTYDSEEVDLEIYEFEHDGHDYLIFTEYGQTINVIHDPSCKPCK